MQACERLDDGVCSGWIAVERALCQGCMLAPLLFNIFVALVINVTHKRFYTRFKAGKDIKDAMVHVGKKTRVEGRGGQPPESQS